MSRVTHARQGHGRNKICPQAELPVIFLFHSLRFSSFSFFTEPFLPKKSYISKTTKWTCVCGSVFGERGPADCSVRLSSPPVQASKLTPQCKLSQGQVGRLLAWMSFQRPFWKRGEMKSGGEPEGQRGCVSSVKPHSSLRDLDVKTSGSGPGLRWALC